MADTGASVAARTLAARGVTTIFTLCGDHTNPLLDAVDTAGIAIVDARDERGAAWMAAGWALGTGRAGVVVVSNTPALLNAATALADADASGIPVVCLTGGIAARDRGKGHPGDADQTAIAAPWTRLSATVPSADALGDHLAAGFAAASGPRRGAAVLDIPLDVQQARTTAPDAAPAPGTDRAPNVTEAAAALGRAQRPVLLAGEGCWWSGAGEALRALAERGRIPVFTARAARGLLSDDHELCMGFPNLLAPAAQTAFGEADVALIAGARLDLTLAHGGFHPDCTVIRVDADEDAFTSGRAADIPIVADPAVVLRALAAEASPLPTGPWIARLREAVQAHRALQVERGSIDTSPVHPGRLAAEVAAALPTDAIVCVDAGELALWAIDAIPARAPASFHASSFSPLGALGMGVPWAIGLKVAHPQRPVLALCGDGSFGFTGIELATSTRHGAPVATVIGNDGGWGIVRHLQQELHGRSIASDLPVAPYGLFAEFAGGVGDRIDQARHLPIALTNALVARVPSVIDVRIDPQVRHPAIDMIAAMFK
jgi:acetolactate synthase-1/2/3 large subunit